MNVESKLDSNFGFQFVKKGSKVVESVKESIILTKNKF